jgi:hypothetical protein
MEAPMGCDCSTHWDTWTLIDGTDLIMFDVKSRCEGIPLAYPDGFVGPPMVHQLEPDERGVRPSGPCRVTYEILNYHGVDFLITSFATGGDLFTFNTPLGPGQKKVIQKNGSIRSPSECYKATTGVAQLVHATTGQPQTIGDIEICRIRKPA